MSTEIKSIVPDAVVIAGDAGSVVFRGVTVALDTDVGQAFVIDCARNTEGLIPDAEIRNKYGLSAKDWERLADNKPLLQAVRAERERRIRTGEAATESARHHYVKAPRVLGTILADDQIAPRHRIEAAKELRQAAGNGPETAAEPQQPFIIRIDLGQDYKLVKEFDAPDPARFDERDGS